MTFPRWVRRAAWAALALGCAAVAAFAAREATLFDRWLAYFPQRELEAAPADMGLEYEDVFFQTADGLTLHGWFVPGEGDLCIVWFHGNAGNVSHRVYNLALMHSRVGASVFLFDYRGYGRSQGRPSEPGLYLDGEAAIEQAKLRAGVSDDGLVLFGRSLGGSVAIEMATRRNVRALVVESAFTSIDDMARSTHRLLSRLLPPRLLLKARYDNLSKMPSVRAPALVVHGDDDRTVPHRMGLALHAAAPDPKAMYTIEGAGHNDTHAVGGRPYYDTLREFIHGAGR